MATKKPATKKPAAKKPAVTKKPAAKKPAVTKKPATKKPAAKKPAAKKARAVSATIDGRPTSVAKAKRIFALQFEPRSDTVRLERVGPRSHKFWELTFAGAAYVVREGDAGKKGRSKTFKWSSSYHANFIDGTAAKKMLTAGYKLVSGQIDPPKPIKRARV